MLCSSPSTTAGKSSAGPSWLDRLRTSRGFPLHHPDLDLDHYLHHPTPNNPSFLPPPPPDAGAQAEDLPIDKRLVLSQQNNNNSNEKIRAENEVEKENFFDLMSSALAELFHMGDTEEHVRIRALRDGRSGRKQLNPKVCVLPAPSSGGEQAGCRVPAALSPPSAENSTVGAKKRSAGRVKQGKKRAAACGDGTVDPELAPQSRTEVTVIDTSCSPEWKSEKLIFRKGTVWKVRDKNLWNMSMKKRKLSSKEWLVDGDRPLVKLNERDKNQSSAPMDEGCLDKVMDNVSKVANDGPHSIRERRVHLSRSSHRSIPKDKFVSHSRNLATRKRRSCLQKVP